MFQRLKGAIDSRIAEEQARQRSSQASPSRKNSGTNRSSSRNISPSKRGVRSQAREKKDGEPSKRDRDPSEFEPESIAESEDTPSRSESPRPIQKIGEAASADETAKMEGSKVAIAIKEGKIDSPDNAITSQELPTDIRVKLRKLDKLESRYNELFKSYKDAHTRIEHFETSLRENTPLSSISDPSALIEYLNQLNLKGDMVLDELKRVTAERDKFKEETVKAEKSTKEAWDEVASLRKQNDADGVINDPQENPAEPYTTQDNSLSQGDGDVQPTVLRSPSTSTKSRTGSLASMSMFSPRLKQVESPIVHEESEDFFSYDKELPRLETELHERETIIKVLQAEVKTLKGDLAVARESTQSMVETLEESSRELHALRERKDRTDTELRDKQVSFENRIDQLKVDLATSEEKIHKWEIDHVRCDPSVIMRLEERLKETQSALDNLRAQGNMDSKDANEFQKVSPMISNKEREATEASSSQAEDRYNEKKLNTLNNLVRSLRTQLLEAEEERINLTSKIASEEKSSEALRDQVMQLESKISGERQAELASTNDDTTESKSSNVLSSTASEPVNVIDASAASKKKNKKKRKGVKPAALNDKEVLVDGEKVKSHDTTGISLTLGEESSLREEINRLHVLLEEKEANIEKINDKLKQQDDLREEIETLRDDLIHVGQEHVEAKDKVKSLLAEKCVLETTIQDLEGRVTDLHKIHTSSAAGSEQKQKDLVEQFEDLKLKATNLQNDLVAAQQLASSRYKELTDMRVILQKAQPELIALRSEATESKTFKEALTRKEAELKRLDSKHEEIRIEIVRLKQIISERDSEIKSLNQKLSQEAISRLKMEDMNSKTNQEIQRLETERRQASESIDKLSKDLSKSRGDLAASRTTMEDLDQQNFRIKRDSESLKEEIDLKTAQHASAQSLLGSMRDQITELAMQVKEARDRCESLDEEAAEARRLLGERSREGETMRRLLADAEGRTDAKIREMKERMDIAIEERDRAEDEASTAARRKARELEDMRNKIREAERGLKRAEEENEELESAQREWRRRREELEQKSGNYVKEVDDVRKAMGELRDALDESERQARELEKQKAEMRRSVEDTQHRLEKLQKSNKSLADEIRVMQTAKTKAMASETQSSRSSLDTATTRIPLGSPPPKGKNSSATATSADDSNGHAPISMDYVYLKNVLLQFLEQKDKKHQIQLIPVLGMLLHFDRKDEQKWMSTITAK